MPDKYILRRIVLLPCMLLALLWATGCKSFYALKVDQVPYKLGDTEVRIRRVMNADSGFVFINLHENENTSVKSARKYLKRHPGKMFILNHSGARRVNFVLNGSAYHFDPNRMFTEEGIRRTLKGSGPNRNQAEFAIAEFGRYVYQQLKIHELKKIVALHNNGPDEFSLLSYLPDGEYSQDASAVFQNQSMDHDDFFFTTDTLIFEELKARNWNVALQDNRQASDDGSLSVHLRANNISYVNVEAEQGHRKTQYKMYLVLDSVYHRLDVIE